MHTPFRIRTLAAAVFTLTTLWACSDAPEPLAPPTDLVHADSYWTNLGEQNPFKVYTQNAYVGGDTGPIFSLDLSDIPAVVQATSTFWAQVEGTRTVERAGAIVDEIAAYEPQVVALQEVFRFAVIDATTGQVVDGADMLAAIQGHIAARGLPYEVVRVQENTSITLPLALGATGLTRALNVTDRVAVLRRTDVSVLSSAQGTYAARLDLGPAQITRGWIRLTTERDGVPYHVVTTHLETQGLAPIQAAQAEELRDDVLDGLDGVTVLVGDLNSDAAGGPGDPSWTPTYQMLRAAGFADAWVDSGQPAHDPGFTCCQAPDLLNGASILNQRIDFVLVRGRGMNVQGSLPGSSHVDIVGEEQSDRTAANGLWPADHAGLMAGLSLPSGLNR